MKTLASLALIGFTYGSESNELFKHTSFRPELQVVLTSRNIYQKPILKPISGKISVSSEHSHVTKSIEIVQKNDDFFSSENFSENEFGFFGNIGSILKSHLTNKGKEANPTQINFDDNDDKLLYLQQLIKDGIKSYNDAKQNTRNYGDLTKDSVNFIREIKQHDDEYYLRFPYIENKKEYFYQVIMDSLKENQIDKEVIEELINNTPQYDETDNIFTDIEKLKESLGQRREAKNNNSKDKRDKNDIEIKTVSDANGNRMFLDDDSELF